MHKPHEKAGKYLHGKWWESSGDDFEKEEEYETNRGHEDNYDPNDPEKRELEQLQHNLQTLLSPQMQQSTNPHQSPSEMPTPDAKKILGKFKNLSRIDDVPKNDEKKHDGDNKGTEESSETNQNGEQGKVSSE